MSTLFGLIGTAISLLAFIPYVKSILAGITKPHLFTWLIWTLVTGIAGIGQYVAGAGPSAWCTLAITATCFATFMVSIKHGTRDITRFDWLCLLTALAAIPIWLITKDPTISICIVTSIELVGFFPTFRKTLFDPYSESMLYFLLTVLKYGFSVAALEKWTIATAIYPCVTLIACILFCAVMWIARKKLENNNAKDTPLP
ncbi:MAG: hypothetical protein DI551_11675 [Micavibrio aeruginosavorus]|uniref:Uncharacterized protein n=1 Tax=Micavibrio aeruginosavorus TaxID=349221 RepID=A0A2W5MYE5_9BACT|nr:MAG: hypothetical protein DI551_11675 [Micavibrio aeruginosavorus]